MICAANLKIMDVVAKYPGSTHDAYIFKNSGIYDRFDSGEFTSGIMLADSGYPLTTWLMTPFINATTPAQVRYNYAHIRTRNTIERTFGLLKSRFRCLDVTGGMLLYDAAKVCEIIMCCCILHNICIEHENDNEFDCDTAVTEEQHREVILSHHAKLQRDHIVSQYFS
ncbi:putative nuclease HARBI1 [Xenopus laevis]|uniref:Nuclease HARBI1 n=1 Tax=Xenopus laevis TaxID=8355 RepID=A0A8J1L1V0_XENLA|nr:putative nuclease HARBI1 [Xenopus laevis]